MHKREKATHKSYPNIQFVGWRRNTLPKFNLKKTTEKKNLTVHNSRHLNWLFAIGDHKAGKEEEFKWTEPRRSLQRLAPSSALLFSARGLLPALLFESDPNAVFCRTPVGDDPIGGLVSQPSVMRFSTDDVEEEDLLQSAELALLLLVWWRTSPSGPPKEVSQLMGIQFACLWWCWWWLVLGVLCSQDSLSGERLVSLLNSEEAWAMSGMEIESWVRSRCASMSCPSECWVSCVFCEVGLRKESDVTRPNSVLDASSYGMWCFRVMNNELSFDRKERPPSVLWILSPAVSFTNILQKET